MRPACTRSASLIASVARLACSEGLFSNAMRTAVGASSGALAEQGGHGLRGRLIGGRRRHRTELVLGEPVHVVAQGFRRDAGTAGQHGQCDRGDGLEEQSSSQAPNVVVRRATRGSGCGSRAGNGAGRRRGRRCSQDPAAPPTGAGRHGRGEIGPLRRWPSSSRLPFPPPRGAGPGKQSDRSAMKRVPRTSRRQGQALARAPAREARRRGPRQGEISSRNDLQRERGLRPRPASPGSLRTHFGQEDQEMGGLKPGARSALANGRWLPTDVSGRTAPARNRGLDVTGPPPNTPGNGNRSGTVGTVISGDVLASRAAPGHRAMQSSWSGTATAPLSDECAGAPLVLRHHGRTRAAHSPPGVADPAAQGQQGDRQQQEPAEHRRNDKRSTPGSSGRRQDSSYRDAALSPTSC